MAVWERIFAHVDMDAFYASVEIRDDPSLEGQPVVVGGAASGRGVVSAASYEARKYGIHSAMPMAEAQRRCPHLVRLPVNFRKYGDVSDQIMEIFRTFSPKIEPLSLDEAFLDLTGTQRVLGTPPEIGRKIKDAIRARTRLTASVGIAPVKFVAKIASDLEKPDGLVIIEPDKVLETLRPLPISRLWGVGPRTREALEALGVHTIGDLADMNRRALVARFGQHGEHLHELAWGRDSREVIPDWEAKSYSHEQTFGRDQTDTELLESVMLDEAFRVSRRLRVDAAAGRIVQLKLRYHDFRTLTRRTTLSSATCDANRIYEVARHLFREHWNGQAVRLIGVGVSGIAADGCETLDLFAPPESQEKRRRLSETIDRIEERFGRGKVLPAKLLRIQDERRDDDSNLRPRADEEDDTPDDRS
jgi:DNA polymerase-4